VIKSSPANLPISADAKPQTQAVNLLLKVGYQIGKFNLAVGAMYQDANWRGTASGSYTTHHAVFGLQGDLGPEKTGGMGYGDAHRHHPGALRLRIDMRSEGMRRRYCHRSAEPVKAPPAS
jgi:hypothetical protein